MKTFFQNCPAILIVLTKADVEKIQRNVRRIAQNQMDLTHILKESISVLNVTRLKVKENRQKNQRDNSNDRTNRG